MLTSLELKLQLSVILVLVLKGQEQLLDIFLNQEGASQNSHDFIDEPSPKSHFSHSITQVFLRCENRIIRIGV